MPIKSPPMLCSHVRYGTTPFETLFVVEEHLGLARGLLECRTCGTTYLLEMIDLRGNDRAYRIAEVASSHARAFARTLTRGTCDINRADGELQHLEMRSRLLPAVVTMTGGTVTGVRVLPDTTKVPKLHWRALPCDGKWLDDLQEDLNHPQS
jgi:hypothetical protein